MDNITALVSNIQKFTVHDGMGIRTTVFLLGCPLRCKWCQNPEAIKGTPDIMMSHELCTNCGACIAACPENAIYVGEDGKICTDWGKCTTCFECVKECYFKAREKTGTPYSVDELYDELVKDEEFYKTSGGGVTISGGEPMMSADFVQELFTKLKGRDINTAIETCGFAPWRCFETIFDVTDLFLYDIKLINSEKHKHWTMADNELILRNVRKLAEMGKQIIIRVPLIPDVNDGDKEFANIVTFAKSLKGVDELHILPFHQVGSSKYESVDLKYEMADWKEENAERIEKCKVMAEKMGFRVSVGGTGFRVDRDSHVTRKGYIYNI